MSSDNPNHQDKEEQKKTRKKTLKNIGVSAGQAEIVERYGRAAKEHYVAYSGVDRENGQQLAKGLKQISNSKVNPEFKDQNIKQQAGFSAEVKTVARENAKKIINKDADSRTTRTDDMLRQPDGKGQFVGGKNEPFYDIAKVDSHGIYIEGSGRQLKYVGGDWQECADKLLGKKFDKYRNADVPIEIPSDFYDDVQASYSNRIDKLNEQIKHAEKNGDSELANRHRAQLEKIKKTKDNLRKGELTNKEAIEARKHPVLSTAKDIANNSHLAGIEAAKSGAKIGGTISFIQNAVAVVKGEKDASEAVVDVACDTAGSAALAYANGYLGAATSGALRNSQSSYLQAISDTNLPVMIATTLLETGKTLYKFIDGQIDGTQCLTELGEKGSGIVASSAGMLVGQLLIPIPVVGGVIGSMCGYVLSSFYYSSLTSALQEAKLAHEERLRIEAECEASIAMLKKYQAELENAITAYFSDYISAFESAFASIQQAFSTGDVNYMIDGANTITKKLGGEVLFEDMDGLDARMSDKNVIIL